MNLLAVFHPTPFCNLDCSYCWAPDRNNTVKMGSSVFERAATQIFGESNLKRVDLCWLSGEPLVMGLDYYKGAVELCRNLCSPETSLRFIVQTNGTLLTDEWARFFAENDFTVGVSIDGPRRIHDGQRTGRGGKPSFDRTMSGIELLMKHRVKGGALCVITRETLQLLPEELFFFFHDRRITWSYLLEASIGENATSGRALSPADLPSVERFLGRLMDLWVAHPSSYVRDFDNLARNLFSRTLRQPDVNNLGCLDVVNITSDGDFFWGNPELMTATKGPLQHLRAPLDAGHIWGVRSSPAFLQFEAETHAGVAACARDCPYFAGCQGGNPAHKFYEHGRFDATSHVSCELNNKVIGRLLVARMEAEGNA